MRVDKTLSELWNLVDDGDVGETARMAIKAIQNLQEENRDLNIAIGKYAGQIQEFIGKQQNLNREGLEIARRMFRVDCDD